MDPFEGFKAAQKKGWAHFGPIEVFTTPVAARTVKHAGVRPGQRVLDVACGTGVVAITAARLGARVTGLDLTSELLEMALRNAELAGVEIDWHEGDVEKLPFEDATFDVVLSQFGHMFAPRPDIAIAEMLRVLKPGGTLGFSTWPPDEFVGRTFALISRYLPPPPPGVAPPGQWGDPNVVAERLSAKVQDITFDRATMITPALSPQHHRAIFGRTVGPVIKIFEALSVSDPDRLATFCREYDALAAEFISDNILRQDYLMTRATKL